MTKNITGILASLAVTTWALTAAGQMTNADPVQIDQVEFPQITAQPIDQTVSLGGSTVLTVQSTNADSFQWMRNGVVLDGQTNGSLTLNQVGLDDLGYYTCCVLKNNEVVPTRTATVTACKATGGGTITVFGLPVMSGGTAPSCPGAYAGYLNFTKTVSQGWGWDPTAESVHTATDTNRTDTKIVYVGKYGDNGCAPTTVTVNPSPSPAYRFTVYFPNVVPTNAYGITLSGFNP